MAGASSGGPSAAPRWTATSLAAGVLLIAVLAGPCGAPRAAAAAAALCALAASPLAALLCAPAASPICKAHVFRDPGAAEARAALLAHLEGVYRKDVDNARMSFHYYLDAPGSPVDKVLLDRVRYASGIVSSVQAAVGDDYDLYTDSTDEVFISHVNHDNGGDQGLFTAHYDGTNHNGYLRAAGGVVRCLVYLKSDGCVKIECNSSGVEVEPVTDDYLMIDFDSELHTPKGKPDATTRIILKTQFICVRKGFYNTMRFRALFWWHRFVFGVVKENMECNKNPGSAFAKFWGLAFNNGFRLLNCIHASLNPIICLVLLVALKGVHWSALSYWFNIYICIWRQVSLDFARSVGKTLTGVRIVGLASAFMPFARPAYEAVVGDLARLTGAGLGAVTLSALRLLWRVAGVAQIARGFLLHQAAYHALGDKATYYGRELSPKQTFPRVTKYPYNGAIDDPMLAGIEMMLIGVCIIMPQAALVNWRLMFGHFGMNMMLKFVEGHMTNFHHVFCTRPQPLAEYVKQHK